MAFWFWVQIICVTIVLNLYGIGGSSVVPESPTRAAVVVESEEFVRLPLLQSILISSTVPPTHTDKEELRNDSGHLQSLLFVDSVEQSADTTTVDDGANGDPPPGDESEDLDNDNITEEESVTTTKNPPEEEADEVEQSVDDEDEVVKENRSDSGGGDQFDKVDLIDFVQELERQADVQERSGMLPEILDIIHGVTQSRVNNTTTQHPPASYTFPPLLSKYEKEEDDDKDSSSSSVKMVTYTMGQGNVELFPNPNNQTKKTQQHSSFHISFNDEGDLELPSEDISDFSEEIIDGITAGIEESLRISDDLELPEDITNPSTLLHPDNSSQTRQFSIYLFQGQYYSEPRLNRFIDGALRNMGTELRVASMDPLFFRVLPRGQVAEGDTPLITVNPASGGGGGGGGTRRRRPNIVKRQVPAFFRAAANKRKKQQQQRKKIIRNRKKVQRVNGGVSLLNRRRQQQQRLKRQRLQRQRLRQQKLQRLRNKKKKQQQLKKKRKQNQKKQQLFNRIRRRIRQDVGGGRIEGLSKVQMDGDAEMQLFGNYTLIRSHMKMGPVEITMQFRTNNGIRRSGATLPIVRAHTVTRVNHEGSEMIDYLLDRPHPETIHVRGTLFPLAQKIARNIFARLFLPTSFLTQKLREKAGLAYLSRPVLKKR